MKKKTLVFVLAASMLLPVTAYASESNPYEEHVEFSNSFLWMVEGTDYTEDNLYQWVSETFNVDIDVKFIANSEHSATLRTWIYGDTLPDTAIWAGFNMVEYKDYADQGLIAPLPDGWEETYPNLYAMYQKTGVYENLKIDGKHYAIPHAIYCNFVDIDAPVPTAEIMYYRKDWAEQLGFDFADKDTVTVSEFEEYLTACVEQDIAGTGATIGLTADKSELIPQYMNMVKGSNINFNSFVRAEDTQEYVWVPEAETDLIVEGISELREWYQTGLLDQEFYIASTEDAQNKFTAGLAAAHMGRCHVHGILGIQTGIEAANENLTYNDAVGTVTLTNDDGSFHFTETGNYYTHSIFSPSIDEVTMDRILSIADFFCTKEGQYYMYCGVKGEEWDYEENGDVLSGVEHPSSLMWCFLAIVSDDFSFGSPVYPAEIRERSVSLIEGLKANGAPVEINYEYMFYTSDAKNNYSIDVASKIVELIANEEDIAESWSAFTGEYQTMVTPLLEELNALQ